MSESVTRKYRCDECGTLYDFEDDAHTCCPPSVSAVFVCLECGDWHREESEATGLHAAAERAGIEAAAVKKQSAQIVDAPKPKKGKKKGATE